MSLSRFFHEEIYRGRDFLDKIADFPLVVCGAGALGSNLVDTLSRTGLRNIKVIDKDKVDSHNIGTQVYADRDVGAWKTEALRSRVFQTCGVEIDIATKELTPDNIKSIIHNPSKNGGLVVDCFDNSKSRRMVQDYCRSIGGYCLHIGVAADYGEVIWDDKYRVPDDTGLDICDYPLARNLILIVISVAAEQIINYLSDDLERPFWNYSITLKDFAVRKLDIPIRRE